MRRAAFPPPITTVVRLVATGVALLSLIPAPGSSSPAGRGTRHPWIDAGGAAAPPPIRTTASNGTWSPITPAGSPPSPRSAGSAIYDPVGKRMLVFGGDDGNNHGLNELWALSLFGDPTWTMLNPSGGPPGPRLFHTAVYDTARRRMLVFGGTPDGTNNLSDVWALSLTGSLTWTPLSTSGTPPALSRHSAIYDPRGDRMIVFGGSDVWSLSLGGSPTWTHLGITGGPPPSRTNQSAIYDSVGRRMIVFGGGDGGAVYFDDVWALSLDGNLEWSLLSTTGGPPVGRRTHTAVFDPVRSRMVVYGGDHGFPDSYLADTWELSLDGAPVWTQLSPADTTPAGRRATMAACDPVGDRMLIFGGDGGAHRNDAWQLYWSAPPLPPPAPSAMSATGTGCAVAVEWTDVSGEIGYVISRDGLDISTTAADIVSYVDASPPIGPHFYCVKAFNAFAYSAAVCDSGTAGSIVPAQPVLERATSGPTGIQLSWLNVPSDTGYVVYRDGSPIGTTAADDTDFVDLNPVTGTSTYCIEAFNACGASTQRCVPLTYRCSPPSSSWARTYGLGASFRDVIALPDGGYAAVGSTSFQTAGNVDVFLARTDLDGNLLWQKTVGTSAADDGYGLARTADGGFVIAGRRSVNLGDGWLIRCDSSGDTLWTRTFGGSGRQFLAAVTPTPDGGLVLAGGNLSSLRLIKTDAEGATIWTRQFSGAGIGTLPTPMDVIVTSDGGLAVGAGPILLKTDSLGAEAWRAEPGDILCQTVAEFADGGFVTAGFNQGAGYGGAMRTDASGNVVWTYYDDGVATNATRAALPAPDGGAWIAGETCCGVDASPMASLARLDPAGAPAFSHQQSDSGYSSANSMRPAPDGGFILAGSVQSGSGASGYLVKRDCSEAASNVSAGESQGTDLAFALGPPHPNPASSGLSFTISLPREMQVRVGIYDIAGRLVRPLVDQRLPAGPHRLGFSRGDGSGRLGSGLYFLRLQSATAHVTRSFVILE